jgi:hypothetical protein
LYSATNAAGFFTYNYYQAVYFIFKETGQELIADVEYIVTN